MTAAGPESVRLELLLPTRVRPGALVPIRLRAQNVTRHPLDVYLRGRTITWDVVIERAAGEVVWRRLEGEIIPTILHVRALAPGAVGGDCVMDALKEALRYVFAVKGEAGKVALDRWISWARRCRLPPSTSCWERNGSPGRT